MIIIAILLLYTGFYLLYNTSKKANFPRSMFSVFIHKNPKVFKTFAMLFISISFYISIRTIGLGAGIFMTLVLLMLIASLLVLLFPLKSVKVKKYL